MNSNDDSFPMATYSTDGTDNILVIVPEGFVDTFNVELFGKSLESCFQGTMKTYILSFEKLPSTRASSVWDYLLKAQEKLESEGKTLLLCNLSDLAMDVLGLMEVRDCFKAFNSVDDAIREARKRYSD